MEPRIQYAKTKDGVSIAFWTLGKGMPYVLMPSAPRSHIQLEWEWPEWRQFYERLAQMGRLVRYDSRGCGLSEREVADYSLDAYISDLEAVVDRLGLKTFILGAPTNMGPVAIAYAATRPERVSHLVLWCTAARGSDLFEPTESPREEALRALSDLDPNLYAEIQTLGMIGWSDAEEARRIVAFFRGASTPEALRSAWDTLSKFDVTDFLPQVRAPTLVFHRRERTVPSVDVARGLASRIPDARLVLLQGASIAPFYGDMEAVLQATDEFLGEHEEAAAEPAKAGAFRTVLFTDVEGSTALTQRLGDAKARELLREHERMVREALKAHGGSEVKTMGDGFMASFSSATKALECAIAMQRAFGEHNESAEEPIKVRVGLNAGEPIAEEDDLFGTAVNLAARICANAEAGQILAPIVVRELAAGKQFMFADLGETELRGFEDPVRVYEVRWREEG